MKTVRQVNAVLILLKITMDNEIFLLQTWDDGANQFQLVGGQIEEDESPNRAARRELVEELMFSPPSSARSIDLRVLVDSPVTIEGMSPTFAVRTLYRFWPCDIVLQEGSLIVTPSERWARCIDLLDPAFEGQQAAALYSAISAALSDGFGAVRDSLKLSQIVGTSPAKKQYS
jgi:8-oxo-dGTP pyrophosphatase MutT (NUDIX family)